MSESKATEPKLNKDLRLRRLKVLVPHNAPMLKHDGHPLADKVKNKEEDILLAGPEAVQHACWVHQRILRHLLRTPGVNATDVGFAVLDKNLAFLEILAIRVHVSTKRSADELSQSKLINFTWQEYGEPENAKKKYPIVGVEPGDLCWKPADAKPKCSADRQEPIAEHRLHICGVPLDIIQAQYFPSMRVRPVDSPGVFVGAAGTGSDLSNDELLLTGKGQVDPLVGGISVSNSSGRAGTMATVVWDRTDGTPCFLSNWHVLAGNANARVGDPCFQPAIFDGGTDSEPAGYLKRWYLGDRGDAAIAEISGRRTYASGEVLGLWSTISEVQLPELNMEVRKWGRTSGLTDGFIDGVHLATNLDFGGGVVRHFEDQIHIAPLFTGQSVSQGGDSGSLVVTDFKPRDLLGRLNDWRDSFDCLEDLVQEKLKASAVVDLQKVVEGIKELRDTPGGNPFDQAKLVEIFRRALVKVQNTIIEGSIEAKKTAKSEKEAKAKRKEEADKAAAERKEEADRKTQIVLLLKEIGFDVDSVMKEADRRCQREAARAYFAVALIFAGDTPGSPFGEFAVASPLGPLADELKFSFRPVFSPRSSFRRLRSTFRGPARKGSSGESLFLEPGDSASDDRGQGPIVEPEGSQQGPANAKPP